MTLESRLGGVGANFIYITNLPKRFCC